MRLKLYKVRDRVWYVLISMPAGPLQKINDYLWELPASYKSGMRVPRRVYATDLIRVIGYQ